MKKIFSGMWQYGSKIKLKFNPAISFYLKRKQTLKLNGKTLFSVVSCKNMAWIEKPIQLEQNKEIFGDHTFRVES